MNPSSCSHLSSVTVRDLPESVDGCEDCLREGGVWLHLRICLTCGDASFDDWEPAMSDSIVPLDHQLLTADEVAELLRLPVSTIYDLARTGRLPHLKIGRALRFSRNDLEAHLAERCRAHVAARV